MVCKIKGKGGGPCLKRIEKNGQKITKPGDIIPLERQYPIIYVLRIIQPNLDASKIDKKDTPLDFRRGCIEVKAQLFFSSRFRAQLFIFHHFKAQFFFITVGKYEQGQEIDLP